MASIVGSLAELGYATGRGERAERMLDRRNRRYEFMQTLELERQKEEQRAKEAAQVRKDAAQAIKKWNQAGKNAIKQFDAGNSVQQQSSQNGYDSARKQQQLIKERAGTGYVNMPDYPVVPSAIAAGLANGTLEYTPQQKQELARHNQAWQALASNPRLTPQEKAAGFENLRQKIAAIQGSATPVTPKSGPSAQQQFDANSIVVNGRTWIQQPDGKWTSAMNTDSAKADNQRLTNLINFIKVSQTAGDDPSTYQVYKDEVARLLNVPNTQTQQNSSVWGSQQQPGQQKFSAYGAMYGGAPPGLPNPQPSPVPTSQQQVISPGATGQSPTPTPQQFQGQPGNTEFVKVGDQYFPKEEWENIQASRNQRQQQPTQGQPQQSRTVRTEYVKSLVARVKTATDLKNPDIQNQYNNMTKEEQQEFLRQLQARGI